MMTPWLLLGAAPLAAAAGFMRGVTGFGGAMVFTAPMALLAGPRQAVAVALMLEAFAALPMLPAALREARARTIVPISVAACVTVPLGGYLLVALEPELLRRGIAATVLVLAAMMLRGFRYSGPPRLPTSVGLGAVSGALASATSVGAPPVILYLLSGPDPVAVTRANLTLFIMVTAAAALGVLAYRDVLGAAAVMLALTLAPFFLAGIWLGSRVFPRVDERRFRRYTLLFLIVMAAVLLVT